MVVIRLNRVGATHAPKYRITVADQRRHPQGRFLEVLGHYNPNPSGKEKGLELDLTKTQEWIKKGARPTDRVKSLIRKAEQGKN
ncbi:MAG: 30S ribosomal protein S16 [Bdellovibrionaceae bacterium]|nr:30S ribosomal protein S16 [Bdellovibrionales bacterium]MCB9083700.1 30S ribosomal protein S16 [Pseudobdellovibrionaceae bacterium]